MAAYALVYVAADNTADFPVHLQVTDSLSWLREGFAAEELLDGPLEKGAFVKLRADMAQYRIDAFEVPLAQRRKNCYWPIWMPQSLKKKRWMKLRPMLD